jgi:fumarylacetoacetase
MRDVGETPFVLGRGPATNLYWTLAQLVTHHTSNGCNLNPGDLLGTGTISTPDDSGYGSLLELTRGGQIQIHLPNGEARTFLEKGDEIVLSGIFSTPGRVSIGFGECRGRIEDRPPTCTTTGIPAGQYEDDDRVGARARRARALGLEPRPL